MLQGLIAVAPDSQQGEVVRVSHVCRRFGGLLVSFSGAAEVVKDVSRVVQPPWLFCPLSSASRKFSFPVWIAEISRMTISG